MNPRRLAGPERLEERIDMNADPITTEYLPTAHGTAEVGSAQWQTILSATHANIVHHFESDQAGEQRHLWSGNFYGWEGIAEFDPSLPEGAVLDGAVLRVLIVNAEDTMNRQPSLVAHLSSQDQAGEIATSEYNNAGVTLGSVPFAQMTPGAYVDIPLDPSFIPTTGAISLSLRTSDQIAGLQPVDSHNSRSVISYSGMKLELRYHVPDTNPEPDIVNDIVLPEELTDLLAEAIVLSRNGPEWRTPETGETQEAILRKGYRLNLRDAEAPVVGIRATVAASNGTTLTAYVYRNTELLRTSQVGTDGAFSYDYEEGFTDVVFTTTNDSTVTVSNLTINTDESLETIAGETIDPFSSKPLGIAAAPAVPLPTSISYVAGKLKFYNTSTIGGESRRYIVRDPSQYTLIRAMMSAGSGKISMIGTIRKDGVDYMGREYGSTSGFPDGYARWISENAVVIAPGAPAPISFIVGAYGSKGSIIVSEAGSLETLLPPATMTAATVNSDLMKMNDQFETPGIFAPYSEIREGSSPTFSRPGDIANVQYHIRNEALAGGQVTARVYVGWNSGEPTRGTLQQTETFSMAGGQTVRLSANVSAPAKPDDATSERPIISVVLTLPDGTTVQNTKLGKEPKSHEKIVKTVNGLMRIESQEYTRREQARIHALTDRALNALLSSSDKRLVAARTVLGDDHIVELIAKNTAAALAKENQANNEQAVDEAVIAERDFLQAEFNTIADGIGGTLDEANIWDPDALAEHLEMHSYNPSKNNLLARLSSSEIQTLQRTALGKFFLGAAQRAVEAKNEDELSDVASVIHNATGIAVKKVQIFLRAASTPERRVDLLKQLFAPTDPSQGDQLLRSIFDERVITNGTVLGASIAVIDGRAIRIRFNFVTTDQDFHHGNVYLMSANGQQLSNEPLLTENISDQFYVDISMIDIARVAKNVYGLGGLDFLSDTRFRFKIALWDEFDSSAGLQGSNVTEPIDVPQVISMNRPDYVAIGSYSTLPNTPELNRRKQIEDYALSTIKQNFPLDRSRVWLNTLGSGAHLGEKSAAIDLNIETGGDTDEDQPVKVVADGTIDEIGLDYGSVKVRHVAEINGEMRYWFTKYLHMRLEANGTAPNGEIKYEARDKNGIVIATLYKGQSLEAKDTIGGICGRGLQNEIRNDHAFKTHLHMEAEDDQGNMIHFGNLLADMGIQTYAENNEAVPADMLVGGRRVLKWNNSIDEWVNETYHLIFDQELSSTGHNNVWVAWHDDPAQRKRVTWNGVNWTDVDNPRYIWITNLQMFIYE